MEHLEWDEFDTIPVTGVLTSEGLLPTSSSILIPLTHPSSSSPHPSIITLPSPIHHHPPLTHPPSSSPHPSIITLPSPIHHHPPYQSMIFFLPNHSSSPCSPDVLEEGFSSVSQVHCAVQLDILKLLASCTNMPIAHFLLGFDVRSRKQTKETTLQDPGKKMGHYCGLSQHYSHCYTAAQPGVLGSPRTCLHSILSFVEHSRDPLRSQGYHYQFPKMAELCYHVLCLMCGHPDLSTPTLRYLRNNHDFFHMQLSHLPMSLEGEEKGLVPLLHQQAKVMQMVSVEMRVTSLTQLRSHAQRLLSLLLDESPTEPVTQRKVLRLLDTVDFGCPSAPSLNLVEFDQKAVEQTIQSCEVVEYWTGFRYTDVKALRAILTGELNSISGTPQRQSLIEVRVGVLRGDVGEEMTVK